MTIGHNNDIVLLDMTTRREVLVGMSATFAAWAAGCRYTREDKPKQFTQRAINASGRDEVTVIQTTTDTEVRVTLITDDPSKTDRLSEKLKPVCQAITIETNSDGTIKTLETPYSDCLERRFRLPQALQASK